MANFMKAFDNLDNEVELVIDTYCRQRLFTVTCAEPAEAVRSLAQHDTMPRSGPTEPEASPAKRMNALMLTCGTYDVAGDLAFRGRVAGQERG